MEEREFDIFGPSGPSAPPTQYALAEAGPAQPLGSLKPHHRSMARDAVAGAKPGELAKIYNMSESSISRIMHSPVFVAEVARLETEADEEAVSVREELRVLVPKAKQVLAEELFAQPEDILGRKLRVAVAQDVLSRVEPKQAFVIGGAGGQHLHLHREQHIHQMSTDDLRKEVFGLLDA